MERNAVISLREKLKAGKNLPVTVFIDNMFETINEASMYQFTKWDDENAILYSFRLINPVFDKIPSNREQAIRVFAVDYECIQCMELSTLRLADLGDVVDSIGGIDPKAKAGMINAFNKLLDPNRFEINNKDYNEIYGSNLDTSDDYYNGKMPQSEAETRRYKEHNKLVEEKIEEEKKDPNYVESPIKLAKK